MAAGTRSAGARENAEERAREENEDALAVTRSTESRRVAFQLAGARQ